MRSVGYLPTLIHLMVGLEYDVVSGVTVTQYGESLLSISSGDGVQSTSTWDAIFLNLFVLFKP